MRNQIFTLALGSLLALGTSTAVFAQDNAPTATPDQQQQGAPGHMHRGMDPDRQLQHMTKQLDLTSDQQSQIRPLLLDRQQKMQALWQDQSLSRDDRRGRAQSIQQDTRSKIEAVLHDQQKQKFEAMQARMQEHRRGMHGQNNAADNGQAAPQPQQ